MDINLLKQYKKNNKLTLNDLGGMLDNYDPGNLSKVLRGKLSVSDELYESVKKNLGIDMNLTTPNIDNEQNQERHKESEQSFNAVIYLPNGYINITMPLVGEFAYYDYPMRYADPEYINNLPKYSIIVQKHLLANYLTFESVGDAMEYSSRDSIYDGNKVVCLEIPKEIWLEKLATNRIKYYVVVHSNKSVIIRKITDFNEETITCTPLNKLYEPIILQLNDVNQLFKVVKNVQDYE